MLLAQGPAQPSPAGPAPKQKSVCFAQTAALRREGRALSEKRIGHEGVDGDVYQVQVIHDAFPTVNYMFLC